jgi:nucleoid DNA-binding protein
VIDTGSFVKALRRALPGLFISEVEAERAFEVILSLIPEGLERGATVELEGIGEFRIEPDVSRRRIVFAADRRLMSRVNG